MIGTAAAVGLGLTAAGTGASFYQASQQRKKSAEAEAAAAAAMAEARKKLEVNYYEKLGINREPYELAREAASVTATNLIQAGVESERGAGAVAGRVQMAQNLNQNQIRSDMGTELNNLNKLVASEDVRLNNAKVNLDLGAVEGAQRAAANYENMANNSLTQGFQGVTSLGGQVLAAAPLYAKTGADPTVTTTQAQQAYQSNISTGALGTQYMQNGQPLPYADALKLSGMTEADFLKSLTTNQQSIGLKNYQYPIYVNSNMYDAVSYDGG